MRICPDNLYNIFEDSDLKLALERCKLYLGDNFNECEFTRPKIVNSVGVSFEFIKYASILDFYIDLTKKVFLENGKKYNKDLYKHDYIRIKLNIVNGILNKINPILDPIKVTEGSYLGLEETQNILANILFRIPKNMFENFVWEVSSRGFILKDNGPGKPLVFE